MIIKRNGVANLWRGGSSRNYIDYVSQLATEEEKVECAMFDVVATRNLDKSEASAPDSRTCQEHAPAEFGKYKLLTRADLIGISESEKEQLQRFIGVDFFCVFHSS